MRGLTDPPPTYEALSEQRTAVIEQTTAFVNDVCKDNPQLAGSVIRLLAADYKNVSIHRLLPLPVLGAITGDPGPAVPVCVLSRLWWTGADIFDDLNDGHFDVERVGMSPNEAMIASIACLTVLPTALIARQDLTAQMRMAWVGHLTDGNLDAANGQLADISSVLDAASLTDVMHSYTGKSGSACGRDLAMTAHLAGVDVATVAGWQEFGRRYGVLRQLANDRRSLCKDVRDDEDLANGTRTLLLAHALLGAPGDRQDRLRLLSERARLDLDARTELRGELTRADVAQRYDSYVTDLGRHLNQMVFDLAAPSRFRAAVEWMVDVSVGSAVIGEPARG
nr:hypothetical protein [Micromonospora sp. DSM 115978]